MMTHEEQIKFLEKVCEENITKSVDELRRQIQFTKTLRRTYLTNERINLKLNFLKQMLRNRKIEEKK
jgi:hypothetical protein